jgi:hypothetical protein
MSKKHTPWFPADVKPVHVGVYQVDRVHAYQHWNGRYWGIYCLSMAEARRRADFESMYQEHQWRGLAKKP